MRERAWLGYTDPSALIALTRKDLPHSETARRMVAYYAELAEKRSTYVFLPIISGIERHQGAGELLPVGDLELDGFSERHGAYPYGRVVDFLFALAPDERRHRDVLLLSLIVFGWDQHDRAGPVEEVLASAAAQCRRFYSAPIGATETVRSDQASATPSGSLALELVSIIDEVAARAPWLWLETLFIVENWIAGPQWFDHAFSIETAPKDEVLRQFGA